MLIHFNSLIKTVLASCNDSISPKMLILCGWLLITVDFEPNSYAKKYTLEPLSTTTANTSSLVMLSQYVLFEIHLDLCECTVVQIEKFIFFYIRRQLQKYWNGQTSQYFEWTICEKFVYGKNETLKQIDPEQIMNDSRNNGQIAEIMKKSWKLSGSIHWRYLNKFDWIKC